MSEQRDGEISLNLRPRASNRRPMKIRSGLTPRRVCEHYGNMHSPAKPFRQPWKLVEHEESFAIVDAGNTVLAMIYHEDEPGRRTTMRRLSREDARRLASQVVKLPDLLDELKRHRAARDAPA